MDPLIPTAYETEDSFLYALSSNAAWAGYKAHQNPKFFPIWLGCSDSRCPETTLLGLQPGDVFVHRNIANLVCATDINTAAVIEYAVAHLRVAHVVLCGHTACGGAIAALGGQRVGGVLDTWLAPLRGLVVGHEAELAELPMDEGGGDGSGSGAGARVRRLVELNVKAGVDVLMANVVVTEAVRERGLQVHGCLFDLASGRVRDLGVGTSAGKGVNGVRGGVVRGKHAELVFRGGGGATMAAR
ncbi:carbonic anhydrase [Trichocladium antarcticum]|uniref:Carbonic anhydrase n=1 Tax=Trichocladium antarcticum TaxID=1450529 RepID=A0AAN6UJ74_9PEZI|nr:carbonic anhydrase [Trichocladium antarcticum]